MKTQCITYELMENIRKGIPKETYDDLNALGKCYEKDIGGIDMGFNSIVYLSDYLFLIREGKTNIGFILGQQSGTLFENEKSFQPIAMYLKPEYRNKAGKFKDIKQKSLEALVDILGEKKFDRLNVIPNGFGSSFLVTDVGVEQCLKPLFSLLHVRAKNSEFKDNKELFPLVSFGRNEIYGSEFNPIYLFNPKDYAEKSKGVKK